MKLERYCTCGAVLRTTVAQRKKAQTLSIWYAAHCTPGHANTTADIAEQARMGFGQPGGREHERTKR